MGEPSHGEACDEAIAANLFVMKGTSTAPTKRTVQFHVACFGIWDVERIAPGR